ncbi:MAG: nucleotide pyrophosphohydrolase [Tritonibacter mobilis]|nr:nucleotide pyrophosphohydrolase [Tritonibacter mobilis]
MQDVLELLRAANNERQKEWPGSEKADLAFRAIEVLGETGEAVSEVLALAISGLVLSQASGRVAEAAKKLVRAERGIGGTTVDLEALEDELSDLVIAADLLGQKVGCKPLSVTVPRKFNRTSRKYDLVTLMPENAAAPTSEVE